jgi:two-component system KDP operon response regulator KdpE
MAAEKDTIRILVIDDAPEMTWFLQKALAQEGYQVAIANEPREGLRQAHHFRPDLVLLDVMMPEMDGWAVLHRLREFSEVPVIMLTAISGTDNKIHGLDLGADDYITKPFEVQELKARIRAMLRRATMPSQSSPTLSFDGGRLVIDPASYKVTVQGAPIDLTPVELKLLIYLAFNAGRVLTYEQILANVWGYGYEDSQTNLKVYISRLRNKIEPDPGDPSYILTQWGIGYYMPKI